MPGPRLLSVAYYPPRLVNGVRGTCYRIAPDQESASRQEKCARVPAHFRNIWTLNLDVKWRSDPYVIVYARRQDRTELRRVAQDSARQIERPKAPTGRYWLPACPTTYSFRNAAAGSILEAR